MTASPERSYRYERKFLIESFDHHRELALIRRHPYMFYQPYPPRYINNFYLDNAEMSNYFDNMGGAGDRRKVRLRWYGQLFGKIENPKLELKIKRGLVGTKRLYSFGNFVLANGYDAGELLRMGKSSDLPPEVKIMLLTQEIVLLNRYYRYYFASRDNRFRLTVDINLRFYRVGHFNNHFVHSQNDHRNIIVELKYEKEYDHEAQRVSGFFPFRVTKSSKYVQGIDRVYF